MREQLHLITRPRPWEGTVHLVNMLEQVGCNVLPERVKNNARSLAAGQLRCRHEVTISGNKDNGIGLLLQSDGGNIEADAHIHGLLLEPFHKISIIQICHSAPPGQQVLLGLFLNDPFAMTADLT